MLKIFVLTPVFFKKNDRFAHHNYKKSKKIPKTWQNSNLSMFG